MGHFARASKQLINELLHTVPFTFAILPRKEWANGGSKHNHTLSFGSRNAFKEAQKHEENPRHSECTSL